jgi:hypothetical protein
MSGRRDLNPRPLAPQASALAGLRHVPKNGNTYDKVKFVAESQNLQSHDNHFFTSLQFRKSERFITSLQNFILKRLCESSYTCQILPKGSHGEQVNLGAR